MDVVGSQKSNGVFGSLTAEERAQLAEALKYIDEPKPGNNIDDYIGKFKFIILDL